MTEPVRPRVRQTVVDTTDPRGLAEFYGELLGWPYRAGDEPPPDGEPDPNGEDWLVLRGADGHDLAFQAVRELPRSTWPADDVPQMLHLDMTVPDFDSLLAVRARATDLGATELLDRSNYPDEALFVFADPAGHPFCVFVSDS